MIVMQPDGRFARFSTVVDNFTHADMTRDQALELCVGQLGRFAAEEKVSNAERDVPPCSGHRPNWSDKTTRWRESLRTVALIHGRRVLRETLAEFSLSEEQEKRWLEETMVAIPEDEVRP
jgi:hypothetical protein